MLCGSNTFTRSKSMHPLRHEMFLNFFAHGRLAIGNDGIVLIRLEAMNNDGHLPRSDPSQLFTGSNAVVVK